MAIVIPAYTPTAADTVEVVFPGDKKPTPIPAAKSLTIGQLRRVIDGTKDGDLDGFISIFPAAARAKLDNLHPDQLNSFIGAWLGGDETGADDAPKD